jgi:hypothetical protein
LNEGKLLLALKERNSSRRKRSSESVEIACDEVDVCKSSVLSVEGKLYTGTLLV